jgi:hypothetical protein
LQCSSYFALSLWVEKYISKIQLSSSIVSPPKFGNNCKQASFTYKKNKYFHIKKNDTG